MQRKYIRATVGATDVDIPIHTFLDGQVLTYSGGAITTEVRVRVVGTPITDRVATWFNSETIQDSGILFTNVVTSTSSPTANQVAVFTGTGKAIQNATVTISGGSISSVAFIDSIDPLTWVVGPASAVTNSIAAFNGASGKLIKDSGVLTSTIVTSGSTPTANQAASFTGTGIAIQGNTVTISGGAIASVSTINAINPATWVVGPASAVSGNIATYNGTTGKLIQDGGVVAANLVTSASTPSVNQVATFTGTGKAIQNATVTISGGTIASVTTINAIDPATWVVGPASAVTNNIAAFNGTTGKLIKDSGVLTSTIVTSGSTPTAGQIPRFSGTGVQIATSVASIDGTGNITGVTTINSVDPGTWVVGIAGSVFGEIAVYADTTGRKILSSGKLYTDVVTNTLATGGNKVVTWVSSGKTVQSVPVQIDSSGNMSSVGTINGITLSAHAARHLPAGADSMFESSAWSTNDLPIYDSSSNLLLHRFSGLQRPASTTVGSTAVTPSGAAFTVPRAGNYAVNWEFFVTFGDTSGNVEVVVTWTASSGVAWMSWFGMGAVGVSSSGTTMSLAVPSASGTAVSIFASLQTVTSGTTVTLTFRKSSGVSYTVVAGIARLEQVI